MASVHYLPVERLLFKMIFILYMFKILAPLASCELVPAMFNPETQQVYYNPQSQSQVSTANKDLVVTVAQDVKMESSSQTSKSESFGLNVGFGNGIPTLGVNFNKVKFHQTKQEIHHQAQIVIKIPAGECNEGCKQAFQLANNALHGGSKQNKIN